MVCYKFVCVSRLSRTWMSYVSPMLIHGRYVIYAQQMHTNIEKVYVYDGVYVCVYGWPLMLYRGGNRANAVFNPCVRVLLIFFIYLVWIGQIGWKTPKSIAKTWFSTFWVSKSKQSLTFLCWNSILMIFRTFLVQKSDFLHILMDICVKLLRKRNFFIK